VLLLAAGADHGGCDGDLLGRWACGGGRRSRSGQAAFAAGSVNDANMMAIGARATSWDVVHLVFVNADTGVAAGVTSCLCLGVMPSGGASARLTRARLAVAA
jgi:hypothetical protein